MRVRNRGTATVLALSRTVLCQCCDSSAGRKGVKVTVSGTIIDALGRPNAVPVRKGRTKKDGVAVVASTVPVTGTIGGPIEIRLTLNPAGGKKITGYSGSCGLVVQG